MKYIILILFFLSLKIFANAAVYEPVPEIPNFCPHDTIIDAKSPADDTTVVKYKKRRRLFGGFPCNLKDTFRILEGANNLSKLTRVPEARNELIQLGLLLLWLIFIVPLLLVLAMIYFFVIIYIIFWVSLISIFYILLLSAIALLIGLSFAFWLSFAVVSLGLILGVLSYLAIFNFC